MPLSQSPIKNPFPRTNLISLLRFLSISPHLSYALSPFLVPTTAQVQHSMATTLSSAEPRKRRSAVTVEEDEDVEEEETIEDRRETTELDEQEWNDWGLCSSWSADRPKTVVAGVQSLKSLEKEVGVKMEFGGLGGKIQGDLKQKEDKKHRAVYNNLEDPEMKLQFFSARQIACRLLESRGHLCQKCWLPLEDCMCCDLTPSRLWNGIRFWLYMHPKDYIRPNNTGKLLWQVFGFQDARLCLFGIHEHEENMWKAFQSAGSSMVWCLYPNQHASTKQVEDINFCQIESDSHKISLDGGSRSPLNFVLVDGTWSNAASMFRRLKNRATAVWGDDKLNCIRLPIENASLMHKLRPQPSRDHSCTAAAAAELLEQLHQIPQLSSFDLDKQAIALDSAVKVLLNKLTARRLRRGRAASRA